MQPQLRAYLAFAFRQSNRMDFLQAMEEAPPAALLSEIARKKHNVWETAVWIEIAHRRLVCRADGHFRIIPAGEVKPGDTVLPNELRPVRITACAAGNSPGSRPLVRPTSGCTIAAIPAATKRRCARPCRRCTSRFGRERGFRVQDCGRDRQSKPLAPRPCPLPEP